MDLDVQTLLIVEDDDDTLWALANAFEKEGIKVISTHDGVAALAAVNEHRIDAILCDVVMPKMTGLEFLETLRKTFTDIPVVFLTGHPEIESVIQSLRLGAVDFLQKPSSLAVVKQVVFRALELGRRKRRISNVLDAVGDKESSAEINETELQRDRRVVALLSVSSHFLHNKGDKGK